MKSLVKPLVKFVPLFLMVVLLSSCGMQSIPQSANDVEAKWAEVENQYKRRADLIPNLVNVVKGYATHEKETLEGVVAARASATQIKLSPDMMTKENLDRYAKAQATLSGALSRLMMVSEKYPELKANENFKDLQVQLEGTENRITVARNRYIGSIQEFNNLITVPPTSWYNSMFLKHQKKPQFSVPDLPSIEKAPEVKF